MIAIATEVEAALVQLIAEPSPQVMPVLAVAKVTCRAHIGSPGDEHVTQRIVAEVHIVTPRVPGTVSLSQWLQQRWPHCDLNNNGNGNNGEPAAAAPPQAAAVAAPPPPSTQPSNHRLAAASSPMSAVPGGTAAMAGAIAGAPGSAARAAVTVPGPGRVQVLGSGPSASRLGISQPIAEGLAPRDLVVGQNGLTSARASGTETEASYSGGGSPACMPCLALFFAPPLPAAALSAAAVVTSGPAAVAEGGPPPPPSRAAGRAVQGGPAAAGPGTTGAAAGAPAPAVAAAGDATAGNGNGGRRLAGPATTGLGLGRVGRFPLPPPPPRLPRLPAPEALEVLICLAEALRNLHRRGLTHGSLTPKTIQLQLLEVDSAAAATGAAAAAASATPGAVAAGSPLESCPPAPSTPSTPALPAPSSESRSQPRTPATEPGQGQEGQPAGASPDSRAGKNPNSSSGVASAAGGPTAAAMSPFLSAGADMGGGAGTAGAGTAARSPKPHLAALPAGAEGAPPGAIAEAEAAADTGALAPAAAPAVDAHEAVASGPGGGEGGVKLTAPAADSASPGPLAGADKDVKTAAGGDGASNASPQQPQPPVVPVAPTPSPQQRQKATPGARRRAGPSAHAGGATIRALLPLPSVGPALLQMQTWGRARPVGLPREHMLWCAPELLGAGGGFGWGAPPLARRSGNGSVGGSMGLIGLGPLDQSIGCRGGNHRLRGGNHHNRHFGDGSYGGSIGGGNSRRYRNASALLMGQDPGAAGANTNGITPSCDVYSLGMLMWYLVSGQPPFQHLASQDQVLRIKEIGHLDEQLPFSAELPSGYVQLARRCWAPLPMQRPTMNVVLSEMRSLRAQLLGLPGQRDLGATFGAGAGGEHGFGYGGSSMGEMTADSRLSFTLSLPLSSRDLSNGEEYSLARPPLELAFGANDASGGGGAGGGGVGGGGSGDGAGGANDSSGPPPPPLKSSLPAALLTALTAPRRGSVGGGGGLMDDEDNYSDTDRFTEAHTEASMGGTPYSSPPTAGTTAGGRAGGASVGGASARLRAAAAAAAVAANTARSFRLMRAGHHRAGSTAGSMGRSGGSVPAALLAGYSSRRGVSNSHAPGQWGSIGDAGSGPVPGAQQPQGLASAGGGVSGRHGGGGAGYMATHSSIGRVPSALMAAAAAAAGSLKGRCSSSSALMSLQGTSTPGQNAVAGGQPPAASAMAALRFSNSPCSGGGGGACCGAGGGATTGSSDGSNHGSGAAGPAAAGGAGAAGGGGSGPATASSSGRASAMVTATSASIGCLAVPCGNGSVANSD